MLRRTFQSVALTVSLAIIAFVGGSTPPAAAHNRTTSNEFGSMTISRVTGEARNGATFAGHYHLKRFVTTDSGKTKAFGELVGKVTRPNGDTERVREMTRMRIAKKATLLANTPIVPTTELPTPSGTRTPSQLSCEILHLVLGPLDLDLLGLVIHLDRVVLDIRAVPGAGNLLGNLLCAIVGLLDAPALSDLGGILTRLLNAILGILRA
jgi:hypothetical protein